MVKRNMRKAFLLCLLLASALAPAGTKFVFTYTPSDRAPQVFNGRIVLFFSRSHQQPRKQIDWFKPEPMFMYRAHNLNAGEKVTLSDDNLVSSGEKLSELTGRYYVQAVVDLNLGGRSIGTSPGNLYGASKQLMLEPGDDQAIDLEDCRNEVTAEPLHESEIYKSFSLKSKLLSAWYGRDTSMKAGVLLPVEYLSDAKRKFPVLYVVPGFGGDYKAITEFGGDYGPNMVKPGGEPFIIVVLDPNCPGGHSVFADSDNNGPWGTALTTELIPRLEKQYRAIGTPSARFLTGHSSGGWSTLWLQVAYSDFFGGVWSTSPDPVDFRDFQRINLYDPSQNMFKDAKGQDRPLAREGDKPIVTYKQFSDMERPLRGEQLYSFEAVFSPKGPDGEPQQLWDRQTGAINPVTAEAWKRYDIDYILRKRWQELGPKLAGKLHIFMGDMDTFYLDSATRQLKKDLKSLGSDAEVEILPGDHFTVMTDALLKKMGMEIGAQYRKLNGISSSAPPKKK